MYGKPMQLIFEELSHRLLGNLFYLYWTLESSGEPGNLMDEQRSLIILNSLRQHGAQPKKFRSPALIN